MFPCLASTSTRSEFSIFRDAMGALLEQEQFQEHMLVDYIAGVGYR
jgi:hypothetical protein